MKKCVFAGSFDPFTVGHFDTVEKSLRLFDEVVVAVAQNKEKKTLFTQEERGEMVKAVYQNEPRVRVVVWSGAIVDLLKREKTDFYVRGLRSPVDVEYENADFFASRDLSESMVTIYLPAEQKHLHVSSTLVRNCIAFEKPFDRYVPKAVADYIARKRGK